MKATTQPSKAVTLVTNGINLKTLGANLAQDGAKLGKEHEAAHLNVSQGLTTSVLAHMKTLYDKRDSIGLEGSLRVFWDAYIEAAPTAYAENKRGSITKSESLTICRAWDKKAKFGFASLNKMTTAARAFLNPDAAKGKDDAVPVTPKANTSANADKFVRQQATMLMAYADKNKKLLSDAAYHAIAELSEAIKAIPEA